jgi:anti-anti-sigma regulatory factor
MAVKKGSTKKKNSGNTYSLPEHLMIEDASSFADSLLNMLSENSELSLDMRKLEKIDTSIIQILYGLTLEARAVNKSLHFIGPLKDELRKNLMFCSLLSERNEGDVLFPELTPEGVCLEFK